MKTRGFTLVELSIVLVVLGLLVGSVLAGQSLIRSAELRSIIKEKETFTLALHTFNEKYDALPGDMTNATEFWGAEDADAATCRNTFSDGVETCNGNGDNFIGYPIFQWGIAGTTEYGEMFRAWQHLANAELIAGKGTFSGRADYYVADCHGGVPHKNCPNSRVDRGLWSLMYVGMPAGWAGLYVQPYGNALFLGRDAYSDMALLPILTPMDLYYVDQKADDGRPGGGKILAPAGTGVATDCATSATASTAEYNVTNTAVSCTVFVITGF